MPTPTRGPEGDYSPGDIAERELTGPKEQPPLRLDRRDLDEEPPKDRDREPEPPKEEDGDGE